MVLQSIMRSTPLRSPRKSVRFASPIILHSHSLSSYLRSPYPSAPNSPIGQTDSEGSNQWPKYSDADDAISSARPVYLSPVTPPRPFPSIGHSIFSPAVSSINRARKPGPLNLESLLNEESLALEETADSADEPMVTALEYHGSAVQHLLSPGIPKPGPTSNRIRDSLMSPGKKSSIVVRKDFTAPSPNDPFAAFPSFAAALSMGS